MIFVTLVIPLSGHPAPLERDPAILAELQALYGISEQAAIDRMAREAEARRLHHILRDHLGETWAGAWIDPESVELVVATTQADFSEIIQHLGARARVVETSLSDLQALADSIRDQQATDDQLRALIRALSIDYPANSVVIEVKPESKAQVRDGLALGPEFNNLVRFEVMEHLPQPSAVIRGANCYENDDTEQQCSVGFFVENDSSVKGYITAAHCSFGAGDPVSECDSSTSIGEFEQSDWFNSDEAWVDTNSSFAPVSQINGYSDGILNVPSRNAGVVEAPIYSTICRYGWKTGGPHCGQTLQKNDFLTVCVSADASGNCNQYTTLSGLTRTSACIDMGDSGGPFITPDGQAQGTLFGGYNGTCGPGGGTQESWFTPIRDTATSYDLAVLTTHGSVAPAVDAFICPDYANSGGGNYVCKINHYDAQGITTTDWTTNTGDSSQSSMLFGSCNPHQTVAVDLEVSNQYGNDLESASFPCPTGPVP